MNEDLLKRIEEYYDSINQKFLYRYDNIKKLYLSQLILFVYGVICFATILEFNSELNSKSKPIISEVINFLLTNFISLNISSLNQWSVFILILILGFLVFYSNYKRKNNRMKKKGVDLIAYKFCLSFFTKRELKMFLINGDISHYNNLKRNIKWIDFPYSRFVPKNGSEKNPFTLAEIRQQLKDKFEYLEFNDESNFIINSLKELKNKVIKRVEYNADIEKLKPLLDLQVILEYIKIKPQDLDYDGSQLIDNKKEFLMSFVRELYNLPVTEAQIEIEKKNKNNNISSMINGIGLLFSSKNIIVFFLTWALLIFIICFIGLKILTLVYSISFDSTIVLGLVSIPIGSSITLLVFYKKR